MNLVAGQLVQLEQREQQLLVLQQLGELQPERLRLLEQQWLQRVVVWVQQRALQLRLRHR